MSSCSLYFLAPDNGADHRTSVGDEQLLCLLSHPACLRPVVKKFTLPEKFLHEFSALLSTISSSVDIMLHYCYKWQYIQATSQGLIVCLIAHHFLWARRLQFHTTFCNRLACIIDVPLGQSQETPAVMSPCWRWHFQSWLWIWLLISQVFSYCKAPSHYRLLQVYRNLIKVFSLIGEMSMAVFEKRWSMSWWG